MKIKYFPLVCVVAIFAGTQGQAADEAPDGYVHHLKPTKPLFLPDSLYPSLKNQMDPPPAPQSEGQRADEAELLSIQKSRLSVDCERAKSEVFVSVKNFFGTPYGPLSDLEVNKLKNLFDQTRNDADYFIQQLKLEFPRARPFEYLKGLKPCISKEVTNAYPSGHAVLARLYGLILTEIFPQRKASLLARADQVASDRVLSGVHHPTDIVSGKKIGTVLFAELKKSPGFQQELEKSKNSD